MVVVYLRLSILICSVSIDDYKFLSDVKYLDQRLVSASTPCVFNLNLEISFPEYSLCLSLNQAIRSLEQD